MEILRTLLQKGKQKGASFILVGGHALNVYGLTRQTGDVDIVVREQDKKKWRSILESLGYKLFHDHPAFMQFSPPDIVAWPVDVMIVDKETFDGFQRGGKEFDIGGACILVPRIEHLIALKLHALKQNQAYRELKDLDDILELLERTDIDAAGEQFRKFCESYGTVEIYQRILEILEKRKNDRS